MPVLLPCQEALFAAASVADRRLTVASNAVRCATVPASSDCEAAGSSRQDSVEAVMAMQKRRVVAKGERDRGCGPNAWPGLMDVVVNDSMYDSDRIMSRLP